MINSTNNTAIDDNTATTIVLFSLNERINATAKPTIAEAICPVAYKTAGNVILASTV